LRAVDSGGAPLETAEATIPERIELGDRGRQLRLRWRDGPAAALSAATLRNACRCAACVHLRQIGVGARTDAEIGMLQVAQFGVAGLQLVFSDGHRRGIFPWKYLRQLAAIAN